MSEADDSLPGLQATSSPPHVVEIEETLFSDEVVAKATYWLSGRYDIELQRDLARGKLLVVIRGLDGTLSPADAVAAEQRLRRDLIDFRVRSLVHDETRTIRDLLVAKAFDDGADS